MEINNHISFRTDDHLDFIEYLKTNGIPHSVGEILSSLDILESDPNWPVVSEFARKYAPNFLSETIFSKEELLSAEWLRVYSGFRFGYPQPEGAFEYENITYSREHYCKHCSSGLVQVDSFRMKKTPKWGKRHFMELNWVGDELFLTETAKKVLEGAGITGIYFRRVKDKKGTEYFDDIYQMEVAFLLAKGMDEEKTPIQEESVCPYCGVKKYVTKGTGMLAFQREIFTNVPDIVKTYECFGWGHYIARDIIVNQKVYRTIVENDLGRNLIFQPILLVDKTD